jgi:hypothetical protein
MEVNFKIEDNYALNYNGRHIDLHNNFDFVSYHYEIPERQLKLIWKKSSRVLDDELPVLELIHSDVFYLNINYSKDEAFPDDARCLGEISYFPSSERDVNDAFTSQTTPNDNDDIIYVFESGDFIRVGCSRIEIIAK